MRCGVRHGEVGVTGSRVTEVLCELGSRVNGPYKNPNRLRRWRTYRNEFRVKRATRESTGKLQP